MKKSIWFDTSKSSKVEEFYNSGSPVKLHNVTLQDNSGSSKYLSEIKLNTRSSLTTADNSEIDFQQDKRMVKKGLSGSSKYLSEIKLNTRSSLTTADNSKIDFQQDKRMVKKGLKADIKHIFQLSDGDLVTVDGIITLNHSDPVEQQCKNGKFQSMLENNFISDGTGTIKLTLWDSHIDLEKVQQGIPCFSFNNVRVKTFMGSVALTSLAKSQILPHAEPPMELQNVLPPEEPEADDTIVMNAEKILLVSNYTEYASCLNCGKKITELNVVDDIKCTICGSSQ